MPNVDCRKCLFYPAPKTTGQNEELRERTANWTVPFCGKFACEGREFTPLDKEPDLPELKGRRKRNAEVAVQKDPNDLVTS